MKTIELIAFCITRVIGYTLTGACMALLTVGLMSIFFDYENMQRPQWIVLFVTFLIVNSLFTTIIARGSRNV